MRLGRGIALGLSEVPFALEELDGVPARFTALLLLALEVLLVYPFCVYVTCVDSSTDEIEAADMRFERARLSLSRPFNID